MATTSYEITWIKYLMTNLKVIYDQAATLYCDNKAALHIAANSVYHERTKHIEFYCHLIREKIQDDWLKTEYVKSAEQVADALNKALSVASLGHDLTKIGAKNMCSPSCGGC